MFFRRRAASGSFGETLAARFLRSRGYTILRRNCRTPLGEIDILARDGDEIVFVEVKTRGTAQWGDPEDAVTPKKQRRISLAAAEVASRAKIRERPLRFDVVAVLVEEGKEPVVTHYKDAFPLALPNL